jgi:hypothetical protein
LKVAVQQEIKKGIEQPGVARVLHVRVVDNARDGHPVVNVKLPIGVVKWGMKIGEAFSPQLKDANVDWEAVARMIEHGEPGKIVEVEDEAAHKTVEVWVE